MAKFFPQKLKLSIISKSWLIGWSTFLFYVEIWLHVQSIQVKILCFGKFEAETGDNIGSEGVKILDLLKWSRSRDSNPQSRALRGMGESAEFSICF